MSVTLAPCDWDPIECGCTLDMEDEQVQYAVETATFILWALSGRSLGCCELTVRPCRRPCDDVGGNDPWPNPKLIDGEWVNLGCRKCAQPCACAEVCELRLPHAPVCSIEEVIANGEVLSDENYRLEDSEWIVLTNGICFPDCQDMSAPLGDPGTWGIKYTRGIPVPTAGRRAAGKLACEIIKACEGAKDCCLPERTKSVTRQGISFALLDPMDFFDRGRTGLYEVDSFLAAVNPLGRIQGARILSPDWDPRLRMET